MRLVCSLSATLEFSILDDGTTSTWDDDGRIVIESVNTTDSGLTVTAAHEMATHEGAGEHGVGIDGS